MARRECLDGIVACRVIVVVVTSIYDLAEVLNDFCVRIHEIARETNQRSSIRAKKAEVILVVLPKYVPDNGT